MEYVGPLTIRNGSLKEQRLLVREHQKAKLVIDSRWVIQLSEVKHKPGPAAKEKAAVAAKKVNL